MNIEEAIKTGMARMIERRMNISDVVVDRWDEEFVRSSFAGCDTCGYGGSDDSYNVEIYYTTSNNYRMQYYYVYDGSFGDLIKEIDNN